MFFRSNTEFSRDIDKCEILAQNTIAVITRVIVYYSFHHADVHGSVV